MRNETKPHLRLFALIFRQANRRFDVLRSQSFLSAPNERRRKTLTIGNNWERKLFVTRVLKDLTKKRVLELTCAESTVCA